MYLVSKQSFSRFSKPSNDKNGEKKPKVRRFILHLWFRDNLGGGSLNMLEKLGILINLLL